MNCGPFIIYFEKGPSYGHLKEIYICLEKLSPDLFYEATKTYSLVVTTKYNNLRFGKSTKN